MVYNKEERNLTVKAWLNETLPSLPIGHELAVKLNGVDEPIGCGIVNSKFTSEASYMISIEFYGLPDLSEYYPIISTSLIDNIGKDRRASLYFTKNNDFHENAVLVNAQ